MQLSCGAILRKLWPIKGSSTQLLSEATRGTVHRDGTTLRTKWFWNLLRRRKKKRRNRLKLRNQSQRKNINIQWWPNWTNLRVLRCWVKSKRRILSARKIEPIVTTLTMWACLTCLLIPTDQRKAKQRTFKILVTICPNCWWIQVFIKKIKTWSMTSLRLWTKTSWCRMVHLTAKMVSLSCQTEATA